MDTLLHNAKRKKRKTRKCLDEMRKRSRNNTINNNQGVQKLLHSNGQRLNSNSKKGSDNLITSKRLTLTMFAKAVRSETITRPLICDGTQDHHLVLSTRSPETSPLNILLESKSSDVSVKVSNETDIIVRQSDFYENTVNPGSSSDNILLSPMRQLDGCRFEESDNEDTTLSTVTSTSGSNEDFGYHLYEEFLEDIPLYAKKYLSSFIKTDVIRKTKTCLESLFIDKFSQNHENTCIQSDVIPNVQHTIFTSDKSYMTVKETIVQNPMDYIKFGWKQGLHYSDASTPSDAGVSPIHSPPLCSPISQTQTLASIISHTPDYNFYPHRLNE